MADKFAYTSKRLPLTADSSRRRLATRFNSGVMRKDEKLKKVQEVYPGEAALNLDKVREYEQMFISGTDVVSPELILVDNYYVVRNGNHRVCAWIECFKNNYKIEPITFTLSKEPQPSERAKKQLIAFAQYHGQGIDGFMKIRKVPEAKFDEVHGNIQREILCKFNT